MEADEVYKNLVVREHAARSEFDNEEESLVKVWKRLVKVGLKLSRSKPSESNDAHLALKEAYSQYEEALGRLQEAGHRESNTLRTRAEGKALGLKWISQKFKCVSMK